MNPNMSHRRISPFRLAMILLGAALLLAAGWLVLQNLDEQRSAEESASHLLDLAEQHLSELSSSALAGSDAPAESEPASDPWEDYEIDGILSIPTLGLRLPVLADYSDALLQLSVCVLEKEADGSRMVIAGHNYRSHFGQLHELTQGDPVSYTGADGEERSYRVSAVTDIADDDRQGLEAGEWDITLLTCNLDMSRRVLVRLIRDP